MTETPYKWSVEEYHLMIESGLLADKPVELLNGEIIQMSPKRKEHSYTNDDVAELLREKLKGLAKIRESHPVTLDNSEPEPDIAVVRLPKTIYLQHHPYPQDIYWLIEVSNKTLDKRNNAVLGRRLMKWEASQVGFWERSFFPGQLFCVKLHTKNVTVKTRRISKRPGAV